MRVAQSLNGEPSDGVSAFTPTLNIMSAGSHRNPEVAWRRNPLFGQTKQALESATAAGTYSAAMPVMAIVPHPSLRQL